MRADPADTATRTEPGDASAAVGRTLAAAGIVGVALCAVLLGSLHVLPPSAQVSPVRRTISQYALLENGWVFDVAVLSLAAGSVAVLAALVAARLVGWTSGGAVALLMWATGLVGVVVFEKHNWAVGPSMSGDIHRVAGVLAFVSLPMAALLAARAWLRDPRWAPNARWVFGAGVVSLLCFAPIAVAFLAAPWLGVPWWRAIPLGAVERLMGASELATVLTLAWWGLRAAGTPAARRSPPAGGPGD